MSGGKHEIYSGTPIVCDWDREESPAVRDELASEEITLQWRR